MAFRNSLDLDKTDGYFRINNDYADRYDRWREAEERQKLKDRYGDEGEDSGDDTSSSEEEIGDLTPAQDKDFLRILACLKSKDPKIYDPNANFVSETSDDKPTTSGKKPAKEKSMFLKDYERKILTEKKGNLSDEEFAETQDWDEKNTDTLTYNEEQRQLKQSFKEAVECDDVEGDFLTKRVKTKEEQDKEDEDYISWLKGRGTTLKDEKLKADIKPLKEYWADPKLDDGEKFLRDFVLNKMYLDPDDIPKIPTYEEIVNDNEDLSEDERELDEQEEFEHKYNFRFEEPDADFVKSYPRTVDDSLRRKDSRRSEKRKEVKSRKVQEKEKKREELKRLKALKRKEIMDKLEKLQAITGTDKMAFGETDVDGDFDPKEHDKKMAEMYGKDYYEIGEGEDCEKPVFPEDEEFEPENFDRWEIGQDYNGSQDGPHCEDPDFNMDCDYDPKQQFANEMIENSKKKRKSKKSKFTEALERNKPKFDPTDKRFEQYFDEYYKLDYEDLIGGDLPCRFKYRKTTPNAFGLTIEEILEADDKELNRWCSVKKTSQYRSEYEERSDVKSYNQKAKNVLKKRLILASIYQGDENEKKSTIQKAVSKPRAKPVETVVSSESVVSHTSSEKTQRKRKRKRKNTAESNAATTNDGRPHVSKESIETSSKSDPPFATSEDLKSSKAETANSENVTAKAISSKKKKHKLAQNNHISSAIPVEDVKNKQSKGQISQVSGAVSAPKTSSSSFKKNRTSAANTPSTAKKGKKLKSEGNAVKAVFRKKSFKSVAKGSHKDETTSVDNPLKYSDDRLKAYGINPKKFKNKIKYAKKKV